MYSTGTCKELGWKNLYIHTEKKKTLCLGRQDLFIKRQGTLNPPLKQGREQVIECQTLLQVLRGEAIPTEWLREGLTTGVRQKLNPGGGKTRVDVPFRITRALQCNHGMQGCRTTYNMMN